LINHTGSGIGTLKVHFQDFITLIHSCLIVTTPFALISCYSTPFELRYALSLAKVTRLFVDAKLLPKLLPVAKEVGIPTDKIHLLLGNAPGFRTVSELVDRVREKQAPFVGVRPVKNDTLAYLVFSSGTTGLPKGELKYTLQKMSA
jgi:acyl-CoA synthetase (AMP-forming)/AMP-acid ligase II